LTELRMEGRPAVDVLQRFDFLVRADGRVEERRCFARQLIDSAGVQEFGNVAMAAQAATDTLLLEQAFVIGESGAMRGFDARSVQVTDVPARLVFSASRLVVLPFAGLRAGDTMVVAARILHDTRRWPMPWSEIFSHLTSLGVERLEVSVSWDPGAVAPVWNADDPAIRCASAGIRKFRCTREAIPAMRADPDGRGLLDSMPQLALGAPTSWEELARRGRALVERQIGTDVEVARQAARLVADTTSPAQRLRRLFRFVANEIRYVGMEHGTSAIVPHPAAVTLRRQFGDRKDKVTLLIALARSAGIDVFPALVASERFNPDKLVFPTLSYFDHMIACTHGEDPICLDPTAPDLAFGVLPLELLGAVYLPLDGGSGQPARLPSGQAGWDIALVAKKTVDCDGSLAESLERRFFASGAGALRARLRSMPGSERTRWLEEEFQDAVGDPTKPAIEVRGSRRAGFGYRDWDAGSLSRAPAARRYVLRAGARSLARLVREGLSHREPSPGLPPCRAEGVFGDRVRPLP
jgi:Domain of Unknown Function with PDB structure (DUF3857)/Transglutaminase-like superfamily